MGESNSLIFITGSGRSGTTLLSNIINRHHNCTCGTENDFITRLVLQSNKKGYIKNKRAKLILNNLWITKKAFAADWSLKQEDITKIENQLYIKKTPIKIICKQIITKYNPNKKAKILLDKNPFYLQILTKIENKIHPEKYIFIVRHPLDKFSSEKRLNQTLISYGISWAYQQRKILSFAKKYNTKCLIIKYEDLVLRKEETILKTCDFLGILFNKEILNTNSNGKRTFSTEEMKAWHELSNQNITTRRINIWSKNLTKKEVKIVSCYCRKTAKEFGYHLPNISFLEKTFIRIRYGIYRIIPYIYPKFKILFFKLPLMIQKNIVKLIKNF